MCISSKQKLFLKTEQNENKLFSSLPDLRNESNIFSVDRGINQKRTENCINSRSALLQKFSVLYPVDTLFNRKKY